MELKQAMEIFKGNVVYGRYPIQQIPFDVARTPNKDIIKRTPNGTQFIWVDVIEPDGNIITYGSHHLSFTK